MAGAVLAAGTDVRSEEAAHVSARSGYGNHLAVVVGDEPS